MMKHLSKLVPLIAVSAALVLALLPASAPANPVAASISFAGSGTLLSNGTVDVPLHYYCLPPSPGEIGVELDEGGTGFGGTFSILATCDGRNHSVTVNVVGGPFTPGTATGTAFVFNSDAQAHAETSEKVTIK
jgi:hypothetical protein